MESKESVIKKLEAWKEEKKTNKYGCAKIADKIIKKIEGELKHYDTKLKEVL